MYGENTMESYLTVWKIDSQQEFAVCLREFKQDCIDLEGGMAREKGGRFTWEADSC